jgi:hypothetical protein
MGVSRCTATAGSGEAPVVRNAASCIARGGGVESVERPRVTVCFGQTCGSRSDGSHIAERSTKLLEQRRNNPRQGPLTLRQEVGSRAQNQTAF